MRLTTPDGATREYGVEVFDSVPGVFSLDASGSGQAAALNQDGTLNSPSNPAHKGEVMTFYVTGLGAFDAPVEDGSVIGAAPPFPRTVEPFQIYVQAPFGSGAAGMPVEYAGAAPGFVAGLVQINARVPEAASTGDAVLVRIVMDAPNFERSQDGLTIAVE